MSNQNDLALIAGVIEKLASNPVSRFSYTQKAFDENVVDSVDVFDYNAEQNIPRATDLHTKVLDKGFRSQAASITRNGLNHFFGRSSYNLNRMVERFKTMLGLTSAAWAHNAFEYDSGAKYAFGDTCYLIETISGVKTFTFYQRISQSPAAIQDIPPVVTAHWTVMQNKTSTSALLPFKAPGYRHKYSIVDLTVGYVPSSWYPVVTALQDFEASIGNEGTLQVFIEAYCNGPVHGYTGNYKAELAILSKFTGFTASSTDIVIDNSMVNQGDGTIVDPAGSPIGFSKLPKGRQAVLWLKGGSRYALWNSYGSLFSLVTGAYNNQADPVISPVSVRPFTVNVGSINARVQTPNAVSVNEAVNLGQVSGSLPLPTPLSAGVQLDSVCMPGSYYTNSVTIANSISNVPILNPGMFELRVEGDKDGLAMTVQHFVHMATGDEWIRVLSGSTVTVPWYKASSPDGVYIETQGLYAFQINSTGHLILHYQTGTDVPAFHIDADGHLIADI
jgi:hypothetical protein